MPHYKYQTRYQGDSGPQTAVGVLSAENAIVAAQMLRAQGHHVLQLSAVGGGAKAWGEKLKALNYSSGPSAKDILGFTSQLAVMIRAGISIRAALDGIAEQTDNPKFKSMLEKIKQDVESGKQFSEALAKHPKHFGPLYVNMVRASEMSGSFSKMLNRIATYLAQQIETRAMVVGASIYPVVIGSVAIAVTIFLLTFVLPRFAMVFEGKEEHMPGPTKFLMALSGFMVVWWWAVVLALLIAVGAGVLLTRTEAGSRFMDRMKLVVPIFKNMFRALYISRSLHTMGELINAGVPLLDALVITGEISGNHFYKKLWLSVYTSVKQGKKIAQPLAKTPLLPNAVIQMVSAGEESGKLGEVLEEISIYYTKQLKETIKTVTSMIEPIMIVVMGGVVGFIAMAIILPIFKLSSMVN